MPSPKVNRAVGTGAPRAPLRIKGGSKYPKDLIVELKDERDEKSLFAKMKNLQLMASRPSIDVRALDWFSVMSNASPPC